MKHLILSILLIMCFTSGKAEKCEYQHLLDQINQCQKLNELRAKEFSIANLRAYIKTIGIKHGDVVLRQAICESGWGKSYLATHSHNLFGMKYMKGTKGTGTLGQYTKYKSWTDSVDDYLSWQQRKYDGTPDYYTFLVKCGYCENPDYVQILKSIRV